MNAMTPQLTFNNGVHMPALGLGVYQSSPEQTVDAVAAAIASGYRLIDTAAAYYNEREVGKGIKCSGIAREQLFITTKLWMSDYGYDRTLHAFDVSLRKLGLDYLDLYLLHWPVPTDFQATLASWKAAQKLLSDGRVRAIGVCNFSERDLDALAQESQIIPAVNQVELHPFFNQQALRMADTRRGIITQAWSPIGGINRYFNDKPASQDPLTHPVITNLAAKYGKTAAQIVLRWHIEHGVCAIPKSVRPERIAENFAIFDFSLSADEIAAIDALDTGIRGGPDPDLVNTRMFGNTIED
ncbi:aldo/keto reductase [Ottowia sp.]|uniref:aldo/keto reductase n=1 Tax=Ottowia sp. TaxID=1898956 RepID=UPI002BFABB53|nr:aldo/keto reductase [Ottowia sp.]HNR83519.1 aldo/keto reductase [Ottowia sp.]